MDKIETMSPQEVGKLMGLGAETIEYGLRQGRFPWGYAVQTGPNRWRYWINRQKFFDHEGLKEA